MSCPSASRARASQRDSRSLVTVTGGTPATFTERRSPLNRLPAESFDAARWASDGGYRAAYLAAVVPERIWETALPGAGAVPLVVTGSAHLHGAVGASVSVTLRGVPGMPITWLIDRPEVASPAGGAAVQTATVGSDGSWTMTWAIRSAGQARITVGSPASVGNVHIAIDGSPP